MFACIYIPDFAVEAIVRNEPLLRARAVAVLEGKPPLVRVIALNDEARRLGMEAGMTKLQAAIFCDPESPAIEQDVPKQKQIAVQKRPPRAAGLAVLRQRSPEQEKSAHAALLDIAFGFSPRVEDTAPDRVLLDLSGLDRLHGSVNTMARDLSAHLGAAGVEANVAVAPNPDSAMHAACGFKGMTLIACGEESRRLGVLPLQVLLDCFDVPRTTNERIEAKRKRQQLRDKMLDTLERWGVRDFRMLSLLPEHALASRLGEVGARLQRLARGAEMRILTLCEPTLRFEEALELETPVETLEPLAFVLNRLLEQLCARLESRALAAQELKIRLQLEGRTADEATTTAQELFEEDKSDTGVQGYHFERRLRVPVPMREAKVFLKLLQLDLAAHPPGAPVLKILISAEPAPPRTAQRGLFLPITPEAEKLEITLARIIAIVGEHRAGIARLVDTHRSDAFTMERFTAVEIQESLASTLTMSDSKDNSYALRIFRPAVRLKVSTSDGRPAMIAAFAKSDQAPMEGRVVWSAGPWRCSGEWWSERSSQANAEQGSGPWDREEWDIALQNQADSVVGLYRIYHDVGSGQWFAHASYD